MMNFFFSTANAPNDTDNPLFIIMDGQSNNEGRAANADLPTYLQGVISNNVKVWTGTSFDVLEAGVNNNSVATTSSIDEHGSELELVFRLSEEYPDKDIFIVKVGRGATPLYNDELINFHPDMIDSMHDYMISQVNAALVNLSKTWSQLNVWYSWMQGEYDSRTGQDLAASTYEFNLRYKVTKIKEDLSNSNINFIINVINSTIPRDSILLPIVRAAQQTVYDDTDGIYGQLSEGWGMNDDDLHFSSAGQISKGLGESQIIIANN